VPPIQLSVVTPSYNQGRYLADTLESVLAQEGDYVLDYVVMDGGSKDDSVAIIQRYDDLVRRGAYRGRCAGVTFRWVSEKDKGQSDAIVKGFARATGEVLAWLNSDDTYVPGALGLVAERFSRDDDLALLYGKSEFIDEHGTVIGNYPTATFDAERLATFNFIAQPSTFFRRNAFDAIGGISHELHYCMDYDLWIRFANRYPLVYVPERLSTFRLHDESKTVSPAHALANQAETLAAVERHYGWSPLNRVYSYALQLVRSRLAPRVGELPIVPLALMAVPVAAASYLRRNRGIRMADLRMVTPANLRKMFLNPTELSKDYE
jgi:glycosyltransferase involved in cell wall biosynthesis